MKYTTIIEISCEAFDDEDAFHTAGEYLRGNYVDNIHMKCRTFSSPRYKFMKYYLPLLIITAFALLAFSSPIAKSGFNIEKTDMDISIDA